jgi:carbamoyltransferase
LFTQFDEIYNRCYGAPMGFANVFANEFKSKIRGQSYSDEDILCTFHHYLEELLVEKLKKKIGRYRRETGNLCLSGGCALNIKWNSAIRDSGLFDRVYTPPFPNDSGSAIGAACCALFQKTRSVSLVWDVYSGPLVAANGVAPGWVSRPCSIAELARLLHRENQPVILLSGRSELGPRALGNRSIVAPAVSPTMKDILNRIKKRESYRPVSPICLEHKAPDIFDPGTRDPYMLFDHRVRGDWLERVPAIVHLDGSARLQTVSPGENRVVAELLQEYEKLSGIPLLCNTSANFKGCGFFPDVYSATRWNRVNYAWCNHILYEKEDRVGFDG